MADQIATRYGALGWELSHAVIQAMALAARDGVNALDETHRRLDLMRSNLDPLPPPPGRRWRDDLMRDLFPTATVVVDVNSAPSPSWLELDADASAERTIRRLLTAAASWLLAEASTLEDQAGFWETVSGLADEDAEHLQALLDRAAAAGGLLLEHAEAGRWRSLLARYTPAPAPAAGSAAGPAQPGRPFLFVGIGGTGTASIGSAQLWERLRDAQQRESRPLVVCMFSATGTGKTVSFAAVLADLVRQDELAGRALKVVDHARPVTDRFASYRLVLPWRSPARTGSEDVLAWMRTAVREHQPDLLVFDPDDHRRRTMRVLFHRDPLPGPDIEHLRAERLLPDLTDRRIVFTGRPSEYWTTVCAASGARSVEVVPEMVLRWARRRGAPTAASPAEVPLPAAPGTSPATSVSRILSSWSSALRAGLVAVVAATLAVVAVLAIGHSDIGAFVLGPAAVIATVAGVGVVAGGIWRAHVYRTRLTRDEELLCRSVGQAGQVLQDRTPAAGHDRRPAVVHIERTWLATANLPVGDHSSVAS